MFGWLLPETSARAELYKWTKPGGLVVYTDNLSQLPPDVRAYYAKIQEARDAKRKELERTLGKEELERRDAEAKREELAKQALAEDERARRMAGLDAALAQIAKRRADREAAKKAWQERIQRAQRDLDKKLSEFREMSEAWSRLAIQPSHTLLPGQSDERDQLKARLEKLEKEVDALVVEIEETIPDEARKAGVPPGWLR